MCMHLNARSQHLVRAVDIMPLFTPFPYYDLYILAKSVHHSSVYTTSNICMQVARYMMEDS